jgi:DNA-binding NarL/FixJ family response regulator
MTPLSISSSQSEQNGRGQTSPAVDSRAADIDLLIVDDQRVASPGVCTRQHRQREIRVIASTESSEAALRLTIEQKPQVCMVSATLDVGDWLSLVRRLKKLDDPPRVLIYGVSDYRVTGMAIIANADGVLSRYGAPEEGGDVISRVAAGEKIYPDLQPDEVHELLDCVDDADRAIVAMLLERIPRGHIASTLGISARSLRLRRQAILTRLDAARTSAEDRPAVTRVIDAIDRHAANGPERSAGGATGTRARGVHDRPASRSQAPRWPRNHASDGGLPPFQRGCSGRTGSS